MESVSQLATEYCYPRNIRRTVQRRKQDWWAYRVCWYRPTADVMPLWRRDVLALCDAMDGHALVEPVRKALATMSDDQLLKLLAKNSLLSKMPDWDIYGRDRLTDRCDTSDGSLPAGYVSPEETR